MLHSLLLLSALVTLALALPSPLLPRAPVGGVNSTIDWTLCPDTPNDSRETTFYCSSLRVPLNWINPIPEVEADLFLRMYPADEGKRTGSLVLNAGGPGGSTSQWVLMSAATLSPLALGTMDLVGMDPRGVNLTFPNVRVGNSEFNKALFDLNNPPIRVSYDPSIPFNLSDPLVFDTDVKNFDALLARQKLVAQGIHSRTTEDERRSISTAFVARDIAALVDALGEEDGLLTYYGVSYGTILGATFAAMFPEKVGRMVLDGVGDADDYHNNVTAFTNTVASSADEVAGEFYRICALRGPTRCPLASPDNLTAEAGSAFVASQLFSVLHQLFENPLPVFEESGISSFIHVADVYLGFRQILYTPALWQPASVAFALLAAGNGTLFRTLIPAVPAIVIDGDRSLANENVFNRATGGDIETTQSIYCADQGDEGAWKTLKNGTSEDWVKFAAEVRTEGLFGAEIWLADAQGCRVFQDRAFERYSGPFSIKNGLRPLRNPILFVANTHDPITPLSSAHRMAERFEDNASLLIQDGHGHVSLAEISTCTTEAIQLYLVNGTLPTSGTVCQIDDAEQVFPVPALNQTALERRGGEDQARSLEELVDASRRVPMLGLH